MKVNPELLFEKNLDIKNFISDSIRTKAKENPQTMFLYVSNKLIPTGSISYLKISNTSFCPTINMDIAKKAIDGSIDNTRSIIPGAVIVAVISDGVGLLESLFSVDSVRDDGDYLTIAGQLRVPDMYRRCSCSLPGKSAEALACMAQQMGTGFCTNIDLSDTDDAMIWVNGHNSTADFCQYIAQHAYKDDQSFFDAFISIDHNLYFVECNRLFDNYAFKNDINNSFKINKIPSSQLDTVGLPKSNSQEDMIKDSQYMLSNLNSCIGWNNYIENYTIENQPSDSTSDGTRLVIEYYDRNSDEFISEFMETLIDHKEGMIPINAGLVVDGEQDLKGIYDIRTYPMLDTDNYHKNFYWADAFNSMNLRNVRENGICCTTLLNTYIKRGTAIWVDLYRSEENTTDQSEEGEASSSLAVNDEMILDIPKTGFYIVDGIDYIIEGGRMSQYNHLIRRSMTPGKEAGVSITT